MDLEADDASHQNAIVPNVIQCFSAIAVSGSELPGADRWSSCASAEQSHAAEGEISRARGQGIGEEVIQIVLPLEPRHPHADHQAIGDDPRRSDRRQAPAIQPCPTMSVIRNGEIFARSATAIAKGAIKAAAAMLPAPIDAMPRRKSEENDRESTGVPSTTTQCCPDDLVERAVASCQSEQERHPHQCQEQIGRKTGHDLADREPPSPQWREVNSDQPGQCQRDETRG